MVGHIQRFGVALMWTIGTAIGAIMYQQVWVNEIFPLIDKDGLFSDPAIWLDRIVPLVLVILLLAVWVWTISGAIEEERTTRRRRL
jgi:hypothetical protein